VIDDRSQRRAAWSAPTTWFSMLLASALLVCAEEPPSVPPPAAPASARASLLLEPQRIGIGQVGEVELVIVTAPNHTPRPWSPPSEVEGVWLLGSEALPAEKSAARWVHRTRFRLRPRQVGGFVWPGGSLPVEAPDGSTELVEWEELAVEVPSLIPEYPGRTTPFGARPVAPIAAAAPVWGPAAAGALFTLACVGLVALARRRRRAGAAAAPPAGPAQTAPWQRARAEFDTADAQTEERPFDAAHTTARALRRYMESRFGAAAAGRTTEELSRATPPFAVTSRWPAFVSILEGLDAFRFRPDSEPAARASAHARAAELLDEARRFVEASVPPDQRE